MTPPAYAEVLRDLALFRRHAATAESALVLRADLSAALDAVEAAARELASARRELQDARARQAPTAPPRPQRPEPADLSALRKRNEYLVGVAIKHATELRAARCKLRTLKKALAKADADRAAADGRSVSHLASRLGRRGGKLGGKARAERLSAERRSEIARHAAQHRWGRSAEGNESAPDDCRGAG